jgi:hypothetical protein
MAPIFGAILLLRNSHPKGAAAATCGISARVLCKAVNSLEPWHIKYQNARSALV